MILCKYEGKVSFIEGVISLGWTDHATCPSVRSVQDLEANNRELYVLRMHSAMENHVHIVAQLNNMGNPLDI